MPGSCISQAPLLQRAVQYFTNNGGKHPWHQYHHQPLAYTTTFTPLLPNIYRFSSITNNRSTYLSIVPSLGVPLQPALVKWLPLTSDRIILPLSMDTIQCPRYPYFLKGFGINVAGGTLYIQDDRWSILLVVHRSLNHANYSRVAVSIDFN